MIPIIHKINKISDLENIPMEFGVEVDLRHNRGRIIMSHDISDDSNTTFFEDYLEKYNHSLLVVNIKESGIEKDVIKHLEKNEIKKFFLLDIEFPFVLNNHQNYGQFLSLRFSKYETIESIVPFINKIDWIWIDTYETFVLDIETAEILKNFKLCLVSPSRWGDPKMINYYKEMFNNFKLHIEAVMIDKNEEFQF